MGWKIRFYDTKVQKSFEKWPKKIRAKFTLIVELIEEFGPIEIGMPSYKGFWSRFI